jgi:L-arabinokinase
LPLAAATYVAAQLSEEPAVVVRSTRPADADDAPEVSVPLSALQPAVRLAGGITTADYTPVRDKLAANQRQRWVAYAAGPLAVLCGERELTPANGARLLVHSGVPAGKGVSSSAALEVAAMQAFCALYDLRLTGAELALLCQKAENLVAGAPCGVMDQMTAACGEAGRLLSLLCQPAVLGRSVPLPPGVEVWGIDSGIRHAVSGSDYASVRIGAFMGYRIIAAVAGLRAHSVAPGRVEVRDPRWHGYLANVALSEWVAEFERKVPERIDGASFLERYGGTTDLVTAVDPSRAYTVRAPAAHPIHEHFRVRLFRSLLEARHTDEERLRLMGELMYQSHASYSACGLGSGGTDRLVELVRRAGPEVGLYGAKITGGGSGGTVAVLARKDASAVVDEIRRRYARESGHDARLLGGSSSGAMAFGARRLKWSGDNHDELVRERAE